MQASPLEYGIFPRSPVRLDRLRGDFTGRKTLKLPTPPARLRASLPVRSWRYLRLALHLAEGVTTVLAVHPLTSPATHRRLRQRWSRRLLALLGVELHASGAIQPGCLVVANHISWLDIFVLNALAPSAFVSKAEVRDWPIVGRLAAKSETVFLRRGSRGHAKIINGEIGALLDAGRNVALFPEGTTTDGTHVLHFHAALLQPAIESGHPVQPVSISYRTPDDAVSLAPAYVGDVSLGQCLAAIIAERRLLARTVVAPPLTAGEGVTRRALAETARDVIVREIAGEPAVEADRQAATISGDQVDAGENAVHS